jgi:hypothetical protein
VDAPPRAVVVAALERDALLSRELVAVLERTADLMPQETAVTSRMPDLVAANSTPAFAISCSVKLNPKKFIQDTYPKYSH